MQEILLKASKLALKDPHGWENVLANPLEKIIAHRFHQKETSSSGNWVLTPAFAKMEIHHFAEGAMRFCYRLKKISQVPTCNEVHFVKLRYSNYVAKNFKRKFKTDEDDFRRDVEMQHESKLYTEIYNQSGSQLAKEKGEPCPKKIDMINTFLIEFPDREGKPFFAVERFVEGPYLKHNSGFVEEKVCRLTPQTFSHFTFSNSNGNLMVVDIQGVDDLYTDPQIHTKSSRFGDGDLGYRGMALFFENHTCSSLCHFFNLQIFETPKTSQKINLKTFLTDSEISKNKPLASIHLELCKLNLQDRRPLHQINNAASFFHLCKAIQHGCVYATLSLAKYVTFFWEDDEHGLDIIPSSIQFISKEFAEINISTLSTRLWALASDLNCFEANMRFSKTLFETNKWGEALEYLEKAVSVQEGDEGFEERYQGLFLLGQILMDGGDGVDVDLERANEVLMECGQIAMDRGDMFVAGKAFKFVESLGF